MVYLITNVLQNLKVLKNNVLDFIQWTHYYNWMDEEFNFSKKQTKHY